MRLRVYCNPHKLRIHFQNVSIKPPKAVKYLGIKVDQHFIWGEHLTTVATTAYYRVNILKRLTGTAWGLQHSTVINTNKFFLRSVFTSGFTEWFICILLPLSKILNI